MDLIQQGNKLNLYDNTIFKQQVKNFQMNLGSQSISNQSQTFNDYRYQKALKQISKLINVNRQIKIESQNCKQQFQQIQHKNSQLLEINSSLQNENQMLRDQLQSLTMSYAQLEDFCKKTEYQQKQLMKQNQVQSRQKLQIQQKHSAEIQQLQNHFRQQMNQMMLQIHTRDNTIHQLQQKLQYINQLQAENDKLHQSYQLSLKENTQMARKIQHLNQELVTASSKIKENPNQDLINKLRINEEWIKSLNQENYNLKQKVFEEEYKKQREKCNQTILKNVKDTASLINVSSANANEFLIKEYQKQVQKKIKKLQQEKQKVQHKYSKLKLKYQQMEVKNHSLQKQVNHLTIKLSGYEQLAERQQKEIQQMIKEYHKEMDKVIKSKKKIASTHNLAENIQQDDSLNNKQKELKEKVQNLQNQLLQTKVQVEEKDKLVKFLEVKIEALQTERLQLHKVNSELQQQVSQNQNMDLSKTSKNYHKGQTLLKAHTCTKNGGKIFSINGKKYETQVLKNKMSTQSGEQEEDLNQNGEQAMYRTQNEVKEQKKVIFPQGEICYTSTQRNYGSQIPVFSGHRA